MRFPDSLSARDFLGAYWQKKSLFLPAAQDVLSPSISADEIAWLATQPDVESRLVMTERGGKRLAYRVEHGPFEESTLASLPERDWTLLVHDVEKHLPDFRQHIQSIAFIPDWRVDDLMVSVAAPGGSVGPHKDNYDVFLCQGCGTRIWRLADVANVEPDPDSHELSLLKPFDSTASLTAIEGDVLYLPPGVPHWGVAEDLCMTYSLGMRAPNKAELRLCCERLFPDTAPASREAVSAESQRFYRDPDLQQEEATPGQISAATIVRLRQQDLLPAAMSDDQLAVVLGCVVTDPKAWLAPENRDKKAARECLARLSSADELPLHGMARLAFFESGESLVLFANGYYIEMPGTRLAIIRKMCARRKIAGNEIAAMQSDREGKVILEWLLMHGVLDGDW